VLKTMSQTSLNHVSICARDLGDAVRFYCDLFAMEPVPTPNFGYPVQWLRVNNQQLHLFERDSVPGRFHHVAFSVDNFAETYRRSDELGAHDAETFGYHLFELPGDVSQLYLKDPSGNVIEVDAQGASALPADIRSSMRRLADIHPQNQENARATLFL
jgi:catechol 2,3-dioxygenase-like lactoylglutathione lyase family enzyme